MKTIIGTEELKKNMITRFEKEVDYYGDSDCKQYYKYYNRLRNELTKTKKVYVSVIRLKNYKEMTGDKKYYSSVCKMGFSQNGAILTETYHNKKTAETIMIEFNQ